VIRIPAAEFRSHGEPLAVNEQVQINHIFCTAGEDTKRRLYIRRKEDCILAYCHNCGGYGFVSLGNKVKRLEELVADSKEFEENGTPHIALPDDMVFAGMWASWPGEARGWLMKYHVGQRDCLRWGIGYSPALHRVILPVYDDNDSRLIFWQGRALSDKQHPKYISVKAVPKPLFVANRMGDRGDSVVIVEDMLSAIRVSACVDAIALLGTSADFNDLTKLIEPYKEVAVWLDPDVPGRTKTVDLCRQLNLVAPSQVFDLGNLGSGKPNQPKEMSPSAMKAFLFPWT
jgi:hypothetical protein